MRFLKRARRWAGLAGLGLMVAAISQEMSKPEAERTWEGEVLGFVPYDFRPPTWDRIREAYWNPGSPRLFTPRVFGVGWGVNLARAADLLGDAYERLMGPAASRARRQPARARARAAAGRE